VVCLHNVAIIVIGREGCSIKRATASDYIHKVKYLEHSRSAVLRDAITTR
jgi:hypothetical protein